MDTRQAKLDADARVADDDLEPDGGALVSLVWAFGRLPRERPTSCTSGSQHISTLRVSHIGPISAAL